MKFNFTDFLIQKSNLDLHDPSDPEVRSRYGYLEGGVSLSVNLVLFMIKIVMGMLSGSISIIADAVHTVSDIVTSAIVIWGFKVSKQPADKEHPFGHGRMEKIVTLILAILLCVAGLEIFKSAFVRFLEPQIIKANFFMVGVLIICMLVKEWLGRFSFHLAKKINSLALYADAWHHRSDAISTLFVIIAIIGSMFKMFKLDAFFGGAVAIYIIYTGGKLIRDSVFHLLGKAVDQQLQSKIEEIAKSVDGVEGVHDIIAHDYGMHHAISLHVEVSSSLDSVRAHQIATTVETRIAQRIKSSPIVHIDLERKKRQKLSADIKILKTIVKKYPQIINYHGAQISSNESGDFLTLHIVISKMMQVAESHKLEHRLQQSLKTHFRDHKISVHIEPCDSKCDPCAQSCKQTHDQTEDDR